jgi:hypothetical protein
MRISLFRAARFYEQKANMTLNHRDVNDFLSV